jgi:nicotinate-nucleotide adenylyltransferase
MASVGVLGGTFDPVHVGHLLIAEEAVARLSLDRVVFVLASQPPHKPDEPIAPASHRLAMLELAVMPNPSFDVSRAELERPGPSYTVDTLIGLRDRLGTDARLTLIMGMDSLAEFATWRQPERILQLASLAVVPRPDLVPDMSAVEAHVQRIGDRLVVLDMAACGLSSTRIRERVARGLPIRYQVPRAVEAYIRDNRLYVE